MAAINGLRSHDEPALVCCLCDSLLKDPVLLTCLHNSCRQCFTDVASKSTNGNVECRACCDITYAGTEQSNGLINSELHQYAAMPESASCDICIKRLELDREAVEWCPACRFALCATCMPAHLEFHENHCTKSIVERLHFKEMYPRSDVNCRIHNRPLEIACLNCVTVKCLCCWAECNQKKHEMLLVENDSFDSYLKNVVAILSSKERELLEKSTVLENRQCVLSYLKAERMDRLKHVRQRKRRIADALEASFEEIKRLIEDAYDELEMDARNAAAEADCLQSHLDNAWTYVRRLVESSSKREIFKQHGVVQKRLESLSAKVDALSNALCMSRTVSVDFSMPENLDHLVKAWIGTPSLHAAPQVSSSPASATPSLATLSRPQQRQQQQQLSFGAASVTMQLPVSCDDIVLTPDGQLLLAAWEHGMIELCSSGHEVSRWLPPKQRCWEPHKVVDGEEDSVLCVAALSDGRAAAGLLCAKLVILLKRSESKDCSSSGSGAASAEAAADVVHSWTMDRWLDPMQWSPKHLSVYGDVLGASEYLTGRLQLMSVSTGRRLSGELRRDYSIRSLAVTARAVVTASGEKVDLIGGGNGCRSHVLDAHLADDDKRLWRRELIGDGDEQVWGVCADSIGDVLYAAVWTSDLRSSRVSAIHLADGSELRSVALSFDGGGLLPRRLAFSDGAPTACSSSSSGSCCCVRCILAVLCWVPKTGHQKTVTLHRSSCGEGDGECKCRKTKNNL